ncbi:hypothetical protein PLICRDRAFT_481460 [Plicaturopsis crispa FD-325 SS-3]|nr:hypothetical protein PLICRDRAFT_481460 [Plicaturopsis crispa FD-325 SS-3]
MSGIKFLGIVSAVADDAPDVVVFFRERATCQSLTKVEEKPTEGLSILEACHTVLTEDELKFLVKKYNLHRCKLMKQSKYCSERSVFYVDPVFTIQRRKIRDDVKRFYLLAMTTSNAILARSLASKCTEADDATRPPLTIRQALEQDIYSTVRTAVENGLAHISEPQVSTALESDL